MGLRPLEIFQRSTFPVAECVVGQHLGSNLNFQLVRLLLTYVTSPMLLKLCTFMSYVLVVLINCLIVCLSDYLKSYERIWTNFFTGGVSQAKEQSIKCWG